MSTRHAPVLPEGPWATFIRLDHDISELYKKRDALIPAIGRQREACRHAFEPLQNEAFKGWKMCVKCGKQEHLP